MADNTGEHRVSADATVMTTHPESAGQPVVAPQQTDNTTAVLDAAPSEATRHQVCEEEGSPRGGVACPRTEAEAEAASAEVRAALASSGRLASLARLFTSALDRGLVLEPEQVSSHFPSVPEPYHPVLLELQGQICGQIREACMAEFREIVEDTQTDILLNEYDLDGQRKLSLLAQNVEPSRIISSARLKLKREEITTLKSMLQEIQQQQTELEADLKAKQNDVMSLAQKYAPISERLHQVEDAARQWQTALKENRVP